jgi:hypothetical protein
MKNINNFVKKLLYMNGSIKYYDEKAIKCLAGYIENIIFNITSISAIIAFINNSKVIHKNNINIVSSYIKQTCGKTSKILKGGGGSVVMASEFYGVDSGRYLPTNNTADILNIDYSSGILRPEIVGGGDKNFNIIPEQINEILHNYKLKISSDNCKKLSKIIEDYLNCLLNRLKKSKSNISPSIIKKTIESNKLFHIFK